MKLLYKNVLEPEQINNLVLHAGSILPLFASHVKLLNNIM